MMVQEEFTQLLSLYAQEGKKGVVHFTLLEKTCLFFESLKRSLLQHEVTSSEVFIMLEELNRTLPIAAAKPSKDLPVPSSKEKGRRSQVLDRLTLLAHEIMELLEPQEACADPSRVRRSSTKSKLRAQHKIGKRRWVRP